MSLLNTIFTKHQKRGLVAGLDGCGKTAIANLISDRPVVWTHSQANIANFGYNNMEMTTISFFKDCNEVRPLFRYYFLEVTAIIFVVDSTDRLRLDAARDELYMLLAESHLQDAAVLILAHKQDLSGCMSLNEISEALELESLHPRPVRIESSSVHETAERWARHQETAKHQLEAAVRWVQEAVKDNMIGKYAPSTEVYVPGEYVARSKLQVMKDKPKVSEFSNEDNPVVGFIERSSTLRIDSFSKFLNRHYGFAVEPFQGWVFMSAPGCGDHVRQHDYVLALSCDSGGEDSNRPVVCHCHNLAGDELCQFELHNSMLKSVAHFRAMLSETVSKSSTCLKIAMPTGELLPSSGSKMDLLQSLQLDHLVSEVPTALRSRTCAIQ